MRSVKCRKFLNGGTVVWIEEVGEGGLISSEHRVVSEGETGGMDAHVSMALAFINGMAREQVVGVAQTNNTVYVYWE